MPSPASRSSLRRRHEHNERQVLPRRSTLFAERGEITYNTWRWFYRTNNCRGRWRRFSSTPGIPDKGVVGGVALLRGPRRFATIVAYLRVRTTLGMPSAGGLLNRRAGHRGSGEACVAVYS